MSEPARTCVGCGRTAPQRTLVRFVALDGRLTPGRTRPGRGAYICRSRACFETARTRRAFARSLRTSVELRPSDDGDYTEALDG